MAYIAFDNITYTSITVGVAGLDTSWHNGTRTVYWYMREGSSASSSNYDKRGTATLRDGVSDGGWVTFSSLNPGTRYAFYCEIEDSSGNFLIDLEDTEYTDSFVEPTISNFDAYAENLEERQITFETTIDNPDGVRYDLKFYANDRNSTSGGSYLGETSSIEDGIDRSTVTAYGNKLYYVYCELHSRDGGYIETSDTVQVDLRLPTVTISSITQTNGQMTATVRWSVSTSISGMGFMVLARYGSSGSFYEKAGPLASGTRSVTISFDQIGLYTVKVELYDASGSLMDSDTDTIDIIMQKPAKWNWTTAERNAFNNRGSIKVLTRTRWNLFIDAVNSCLTYDGYVEGVDPDLISSSNKMGSDRKMYASSFRAVIAGVDQLSPTGISTSAIQSGKSIKGSYFIDLADAMNSYINSL